MNRRRRSGMTKAEKLVERIERHDQKVAHVENRDGPERAKGEKVGEYHERVKRHDYVTERQVALHATHREVLDRRLAKATAKVTPPVEPTVMRPKRAPHHGRRS